MSLPEYIASLAASIQTNPNETLTPVAKSNLALAKAVQEEVETVRIEAKRVEMLMMADLAWCLGKLQGLGHPAKHIEKEYGLSEENDE